VSAGLVAAAALGAPGVLAGDTVGVVVLKEHAVGSTSQAQPYLDKLMDITAKENGWAGAKGTFHTKRAPAEGAMKADNPHYAILSLAPFLAFREAYKLEPVGQAIVDGGGGLQYFVVSKTAVDLNGCKGKKLATDHADDARFIEKIVANGAFKLSDFTVDATTRPGQAGRKVAGGEAECALIDDAQLTDVAKVDGAVKPVWSSAKLPPMVIVAFPSAPAAERTAFKASLPKLCTGAGQQICKEVGLTALKSGGEAEYQPLISRY
jgi:hypothetical protein